MIETTVFFDFDENKDEWIAFAEKFEKLLDEKEFKNNSLESLIKKFGSLKNVIEFSSSTDSLWLYLNAIFISTRSRKTLCKLNEWIKENHYESNYCLWDNWGNRMHMDLDELLKDYEY